jgi:hypothetical protein
MDRDTVTEGSISGKPRDLNPEAKGPGPKASRFGSQGIMTREAMGSGYGKPRVRDPESQRDRDPGSQRIGIREAKRSGSWKPREMDTGSEEIGIGRRDAKGSGRLGTPEVDRIVYSVLILLTVY